MSQSSQHLPKQPIYAPNKSYLDDGVFADDFDSAFVPEVEVVEMHNALVTSDHLVYENNQFTVLSINFSNELNAMSRVGRLKPLIKAQFFGKTEKHNQGTFLYAYDMWSINYYHWLCEVLPRLWMMKRRYQDGIVIIPDTFVKYTFITDLLKILGLEYLPIQSSRNHRFKSLVAVKTEPKCGNAVPAILESMVKAVKQLLNIPAVKPHRKVYLSRGKASSRRISNEDELMPVLNAAGFEIIYAEDLSVAEQVRVFNETSVLLAMHGGGMANMAFMQPSAKVFEVRAFDMAINPLCYWRLANILSLEWKYISAEKSDVKSNFDDIVLSKEKLSEILSTIS